MALADLAALGSRLLFPFPFGQPAAMVQLGPVVASSGLLSTLFPHSTSRSCSRPVSGRRAAPASSLHTCPPGPAFALRALDGMDAACMWSAPALTDCLRVCFFLQGRACAHVSRCFVWGALGAAGHCAPPRAPCCGTGGFHPQHPNTHQGVCCSRLASRDASGGQGGALGVGAGDWPVACRYSAAVW